MLHTLLAQKHTLVCAVTSLIHCFMMCPRDTIEPLQVRTLIHTVSLGSHTVSCTDSARPVDVAGDKNSYTVLNAHIRLVTSLSQYERKGSQHFWTPVWILQLPCPHVRLSPTSLGCWHSHLTTLRLPAGPFPQQSCRASTHCQANILSHFSGEGTGALPRGQTPRLLPDGTVPISAKCHGWPSLLPGELKLPVLGYQVADPLLWPDGLAWAALPIPPHSLSPKHLSLSGCCARAVR